MCWLGIVVGIGEYVRVDVVCWYVIWTNREKMCITYIVESEEAWCEERISTYPVGRYLLAPGFPRAKRMTLLLKKHPCHART